MLFFAVLIFFWRIEYCSQTAVDGKTCCQVLYPEFHLCQTNATCIVKTLDGEIMGGQDCMVTQDTKFINSINRTETSIVDCIRSKWEAKRRFNEDDSIPFYIEMYPVDIKGKTFIGFDIRMHYIEFDTSRFRLVNLRYCGHPYGDIPRACSPRCVKVSKRDKLDNLSYLSYDCEVGVTRTSSGKLIASGGDTYLFSMCMTDPAAAQRCGEYWFLVPHHSAILDTSREDHQVLLLVDRIEYDQNNEVVVFIPTSHVLLHDADLLSVQLLYDSNEKVPGEYHGESCWHNRSTAAVIHVQNVTFTKFPGQTVRVRLTHFLPSGRYQVAMVPYRKGENGTMEAIAAPSCSPRLEKLNLGKHALALIIVLLFVVIFGGVFFTVYFKYREDDGMIKEQGNVLVVADFDISEKHNTVMDKFFNYLRNCGITDKIYYAADSRNGIDYLINMQHWWQKALRDPKTVKDGFLLFVAGPSPPKETPLRRKFPNLVQMQMAELSQSTFKPTPEEREAGLPPLQFSLLAAILQKRVAVVKFPYSDLASLPKQLPEKIKVNAVISVPLEMKELMRQIQRAEQLSVTVNLQMNLSDSEEGKDLLKAISDVCNSSTTTKRQELPFTSTKKKIKASITKSVSFITQRNEIDELTVPLAAAEELDEDDLSGYSS